LVAVDANAMYLPFAEIHGQRLIPLPPPPLIAAEIRSVVLVDRSYRKMSPHG
jgi:hypothetical protein